MGGTMRNRTPIIIPKNTLQTSDIETCPSMMITIASRRSAVRIQKNPITRFAYKDTTFFAIVTNVVENRTLAEVAAAIRRQEEDTALVRGLALIPQAVRRVANQVKAKNHQKRKKVVQAPDLENANQRALKANLRARARANLRARARANPRARARANPRVPSARVLKAAKAAKEAKVAARAGRNAAPRLLTAPTDLPMVTTIVTTIDLPVMHLIRHRQNAIAPLIQTPAILTQAPMNAIRLAHHTVLLRGISLDTRDTQANQNVETKAKL